MKYIQNILKIDESITLPIMRKFTKQITVIFQCNERKAICDSLVVNHLPFITTGIRLLKIRMSDSFIISTACYSLI